MRAKTRVAGRRLKHSCGICGVRITKMEKYLINKGKPVHESCYRNQGKKKAVTGRKENLNFPKCEICNRTIKRYESVFMIVTGDEGSKVFCNNPDCKKKAKNLI